jgi:hypothetical protein
MNENILETMSKEDINNYVKAFNIFCPKKLVTCPICLEVFYKKRKNQVYCNYKCRNFRKNNKKKDSK